MHILEADTTFSGHTRLTCTTCNTALVRQPYMSDEHWYAAVDNFLATHVVPDETEGRRRLEALELARAAGPRAELEARYGQVWDTDELGRDFEVLGFLAPYTHVRRRADGVEGSVRFQGSPRFYFDFVKA